VSESGRAAAEALAKRRPRRALALADAGLAADPSDPTSAEVRVVALMMLGRKAAAELAATQAVLNDPDDALGWIRLGSLAYGRGRIAEALAAFDAALALDPDSSLAKAGRFATLQRANRLAFALGFLQNVAPIPVIGGLWLYAYDHHPGVGIGLFGLGLVGAIAGSDLSLVVALADPRTSGLLSAETVRDSIRVARYAVLASLCWLAVMPTANFGIGWLALGFTLAAGISARVRSLANRTMRTFLLRLENVALALVTLTAIPRVYSGTIDDGPALARLPAAWRDAALTVDISAMVIFFVGCAFGVLASIMYDQTVDVVVRVRRVVDKSADAGGLFARDRER
jgi:tetratricopeptide (TPR) repeat protein